MKKQKQLEILIKGISGSGKSSVAMLLKQKLEGYMMNCDVEDDDKSALKDVGKLACRLASISQDMRTNGSKILIKTQNMKV